MRLPKSLEGGLKGKLESDLEQINIFVPSSYDCQPANLNCQPGIRVTGMVVAVTITVDSG